MIIECTKCAVTIPVNLDTATPADNPLLVCPACDQLFSESQVKGNPIDLRIQAIQNELLHDNKVLKATNWCEEC